MLIFHSFFFKEQKSFFCHKIAGESQIGLQSIKLNTRVPLVGKKWRNESKKRDVAQ